MKKNKLLTLISTIVLTLMMAVGCDTEQSGSQSAQQIDNGGSKITSLQAVIDSDDTKDGSEIDLSKYSNIKDFDYNAKIDKAVIIKNGDDLKGATLQVVTDGVTLDGIKKASVTTQSSLKISGSSLSSLNIAAVSSSGSLSSVEVNGRGDNGGTSTGFSIRINPPMVETDNTTVANEVKVAIENAQMSMKKFTAGKVELKGMNTQLTINDKNTSIGSIETDTKCQVILEKGTSETIPSSRDKITVSGAGELTQIDMTAVSNKKLIAFTAMSGVISVVKKGAAIDFSNVVMLGTYLTEGKGIKVFRALSEDEFTDTFSKLEKNFVVKIGDSKEEVFKDGKPTDFDWTKLEAKEYDAYIISEYQPQDTGCEYKFKITVIEVENNNNNNNDDKLPEFSLKSIDVKVSDYVKTAYTVGDLLDLRGIVVTGEYQASASLKYNGVVTDYTLDPPNGTVLDKAGTFDVTVSAEDNKHTITITVNEADVSDEGSSSSSEDSSSADESSSSSSENNSSGDESSSSSSENNSSADESSSSSSEDNSSADESSSSSSEDSSSADESSSSSSEDSSSSADDSSVSSGDDSSSSGESSSSSSEDSSSSLDDSSSGDDNSSSSELEPTYSVTLTGGANADINGETTQNDLSGAMDIVTYTAKTGYHFAEFDDINNNGITAARTNGTTVTVSGTPTDNVNITIPDAEANTDTPYTVEHYLENTDDTNYTLVDTVNMTGTTGGQTDAAANTYSHFTAQTFSQSAIAANGSTVIKIYYNRDTVTFTLNLAGGTLEGKNNTVTKLGKFGQSITVENPTREGYTFSGWNTIGGTIPSIFNVTADFTALWTSANGIEVTIDHTSAISVTDTSTDETIILTAAEGFMDYSWKIDGVSASSIEGFIVSDRILTITKASLTAGVVYQISLTAKKGSISYNARVTVKK